MTEYRPRTGLHHVGSDSRLELAQLIQEARQFCPTLVPTSAR
ncbi:MAG TPA: hypothetical protein VNH38_00865 [Candidatus Dormibacteraeota bacterium]|nr:hypothetical protein [Candidatus Dormibacteraeota bacterium]